MPNTKNFNCTLRYTDSSGKFLQGSLNAKILGLVGDSLKARLAEKVIIEGQKKALPYFAISPSLVRELRILNDDITKKHTTELILNRFLVPAITQKFASKGFGTWKGLSKSTRERKTKYKYHPLLNTLAMKSAVRDDWKVRGFRFGKVPAKKIGIEEIEAKDLKPLGFRISFPPSAPKLPYPYTKLRNFRQLLGIHTKGIKKSERPELPPRRAFLTRNEFATYVWKPGMIKFAELWKGELRRRKPKKAGVLNASTIIYIEKLLRDFKIPQSKAIINSLKIKQSLKSLKLVKGEIRSAFESGFAEAIRSKLAKEMVNYAAETVSAFFEKPRLPDQKRVDEARTDRLLYGESEKET